MVKVMIMIMMLAMAIMIIVIEEVVSTVVAIEVQDAAPTESCSKAHMSQ